MDKIRNASGERGACLISVMKFDEQGKHRAKVLWGQIEKWKHSLKKLKPPDVNPGCPTILVYKKEENEKVDEKHGSSFLYSFFLVLTQHC